MKLLKQFIALTILLAAVPSIAQVPRQQPALDEEKMLTDIPSPEITGTDKRTEPDEVRGVSYDNEGKKSFIMGDNTKKGRYDQIRQIGNKNYIVSTNGLYGIANQKGEITTKLIYDSIATGYDSGDGLIVKYKGKYGKISNTGEIIVPIEYNKIVSGNQHVTLVLNNKNEPDVVFNGQKKSLNRTIESIALFSNLVIVKSGGQMGVISNTMIVDFEYDSIFVPIKDTRHKPVNGKSKNNENRLSAVHQSKPFQSVACLVIQKNNKLGLINDEGEILYPADNDEVYDAHLYGYYSVKKGNLYGLYFSKSKDKKRTSIEFDRIIVDGYGAIMASKNQKMGIFNLQGEQIAPFEYDNEFIAQYTGVGFRVSKNKKRGLLDQQGNTIIPPIYDDVSPFTYQNKDVFKVKNAELYGIVDRNGQTLVPLEFEYIDNLNTHFLVVTPQKKVGLYDKRGNILVDAKYRWISKTPSEQSSILVLQEHEKAINFLDAQNKIIFAENIMEYGYVVDEEKLKSPVGRSGFLYIKSQKGKIGLLNEVSGKLVVPFIYDEIIQCITTEELLYFSVRVGKKYGLINEKNEVLIPIKYDDIDLTFATSISQFNDELEINNHGVQVVVAKGKKYGTVNLKDQVVIPFQYSSLKRLAHIGLFKAKTSKQYQIIDPTGKPICKNTFDDVALFEVVYNPLEGAEQWQALTFSDGKMRVIDEKGNFVSDEKPMQPHKGYETFDELKSALISALNSKNDLLLKEFVEKIAPSEHLLFYLKQNLYDESTLFVEVNAVKEKYYNELLAFKQLQWNVDTSLGYRGYDRSSLDVTDFTIHSDPFGIITNARVSDHAYGDTRFMEKLLRNAVKINGYWISTYFMKRGFNRY